MLIQHTCILLHYTHTNFSLCILHAICYLRVISPVIVALAMSGSNFEKPQKAILMESVLCTGTESSLAECTKTELSLSAGKALIGTIDVAAVDCIYDEPTEPPCIKDPKIDPSDKCTVNGASRLMHNGVESMTMGRFEYCLEGYWVPLCQMNGLTASVVCKQLGFNQYTCK